MQYIKLFICVLFIVGVLGQPAPSEQLKRWNEMSLSVPRSNIVAISVNNYAIMAGGLYENGTASNVVDLLDVSTRNISQTSLSVARNNMLAASVGPYAIFAGGYEIINETATSPVNTVEVLNVESMQWKQTQLPDSFFTFGSIVCTSTNNIAVFFNGTNFAMYDPATAQNAWIISEPVEQIGSQNIPMFVVTTGSIVYGANANQENLIGFNLSSSVVIPNLGLFPIPIPSDSRMKGTFAVGENLYIAFDRAVTSVMMYIYDTKNYLWSGHIFPEPNIDAARHLADNRIFACLTDAQFISDGDQSQWYTYDFAIAANASGVTVVNNKYVVIAGGYDDDQLTASMFVLEYIPPPTPVPVAEPQVPTTSASTHTVVVSACVILFVMVTALI